MFTNIEGEWDEVMAVVKQAVDVVAAVSPRVGLVLKADIRPGLRRPADRQGGARRAPAGRLMSEIPPPPSYPPSGPPPPTRRPARREPTCCRRPDRSRRGARAVRCIALAAIGVAIVVALAVAVPMLVTDEPVPTRPVGREVVRRPVGRPHAPTTSTTRRARPSAVEHAPEWLDCGVYDEPVREENAVHDLEHGTVWISYDPDLDADDVDDARRRAAAERHPGAVPRPDRAGRGDRLGPPARARRRGRPAAAALHPDVRRRGDRAGAGRDVCRRRPATPTAAASPAGTEV